MGSVRLVVALALGIGTAGALLPAHDAVAQGDWQVKRDPFDRRVVARYKAILAKNPADRDALKKLVGMYRSYRTLALLVDEYQKELAKNPQDFADLMVLGHILAGDGKQDQALALYERAAAVKPGDAGLQIALGDLYRRRSEPARARAAYEAALAAAGTPALEKIVLRSLADLAQDAGDIEGVKRWLELYLKEAPKDVQVRLDLGDALTQNKRAAEAIDIYRKAEELLRGDPAQRVEVVARIGNALEKSGDDPGAIREYKRAMSMVNRTYYLRRDLTMRIFEIHRRKQTLAELATSLEKEWPAGRRDHFEWDVLAQIYEEVGLQDKAIDAYRAAVKKAPWELDTQRRLIAMLENSGREEEAIRQFEAVVRVAPGESRFQLDLAERYWRRGQQAQALALLKKMESRFPGDAGVFEALADLYTRWGKEDQALAAYTRLTQIEPDSVDHLVDLGVQHYQRGERARALEVWKRIINVKTAANYARLAETYADHDMRDEALAMYAKAIKLEPRNPEFYRGRAQVHERQHRWQEAINDLGTAMSFIPDDKASKQARRETRKRIVQLYQRSGAGKLAIQKSAWKTAFARTPPTTQSRDAGWFLVETALRENQPREAQAVLEKLLTQDDKDADATAELAKVYRDLNRYDDAVKMMEKLLVLSPGREREIYTTIAEIMTEARRDDEAVRYVQKALEKSPNDPVAYVRLAERYEAMQDARAMVKAMAAYEKALSLADKDWPTYFKLARLYQRDPATHAKAAALYRKILEKATDEEVLETAGAKAIDLEEMTGTLGELERVIAPLAFAYAHKEVFRRTLVELYGIYVPQLIARRKLGGKPAQQAREELHRLGTHGLKPLLEALNDLRDEQQQKIAVATLGYLGNKNAAAPLVKLALRPLDPASRRGGVSSSVDIDTRVDALVAAGRLGDERIIPDLIQLSGHSERAIREAALYGLGRTRDKRALPALIGGLKDRNESVQAQACLALAEARATGASGELIAVLRDRNRRDSTRAAAAWALGVLGHDAAVDPLIDTLAEGNDDSQRLAAWALGRIGERRAVPALLAAYFSRHEEVRAAVAWSLAALQAGKPGPAPDVELDYQMRGHTFDADATVRELPGPLGEPPLPLALVTGHEQDIVVGVRAAFERHTDLRVRMLEALDQAPGHITLGPLTAGLARASAADRTQVNALLDRIGNGLAPDLARLAGDRDSKVRLLALSVLAKVNSPEARAALLRGLQDADPLVRRAAMQAAAAHATRRPAEAAALAAAVAGHLAAQDWLERTDAAEALGRFGDRADPAVLIAALDDPIAYVREAAARALGNVGGPAAIGALERTQKDADPGVASAARAALAALRNRKK